MWNLKNIIKIWKVEKGEFTKPKMYTCLLTISDRFEAGFQKW